MKKLLAVLLIAFALASCTNDGPPKPRHVGVGDYMAARSGSEYLGESQDHAFRKKPDGAIIYTDTEDLPATEQDMVRVAAKTYTGQGSKVRRH